LVWAPKLFPIWEGKGEPPTFCPSAPVDKQRGEGLTGPEGKRKKSQMKSSFARIGRAEKKK